jgi:hypothetical protein
MKLFRERLSQIPSLVVDTGYAMSDERSAHGKLRPDAVAKDDWVLKAYEATSVDVVNVSSYDLRYFASLLTKMELPRRAASEPLLDRLVGANTLAESPTVFAPHPYVVRTVALRAADSKRVKVAFIGLTETIPAPPPGFRLIDPAEAAKQVTPDARRNADVVVALAKVSSEEAARIARAATGIDVIIAGNSISVEQSFTPPFYVGKTLVVFTPFETRMLGEIRFYAGAEGKFTTKQRFVGLDEMKVPEDPAAKKFVEGATLAENRARENSKKLLDEWLSQSIQRVNTKREPVANSKAVYVTSAACNQCHMAQYMKWSNSGHAHATDPLPPRAAEFELSCLGCHATAAKTTANTAANNRDAGFQGVQCEQCHGPGSSHIAKPAKGYGRIADLNAACTVCHNSEVNRDFDFKAAWEKIKH